MTQISKIINKKGDITADTTEILNIMRQLWTITYQQSVQPRRIGQVSRNTQPTKTEQKSSR